MPNVMLSWQQAALLAIGLGTLGVVLVRAGQADGIVAGVVALVLTAQACLFRIRWSAAQRAGAPVTPLRQQSGGRPEAQRHAPAAGRGTADGQRPS